MVWGWHKVDWERRIVKEHACRDSFTGVVSGKGHIFTRTRLDWIWSDWIGLDRDLAPSRFLLFRFWKVFILSTGLRRERDGLVMAERNGTEPEPKK